MAGLEELRSAIYHEKQQRGSMLCAQHALNSLLQGNYFTAPDLSDIARNLDALEQTYDDDNIGNTSHNMDDTGFFSVQVLDNGLKVWGLNLSRWRGEDMRPYQDHPHTQLAFILNYQQHWFTMRRFGPAVANVDLDPGHGHWFNLNSFLPAPEWVGKLYLGMVLQQAEADGYSVFAVTQADPSGPPALPRTRADEIAATLPEPSSADRPTMNSHTSFLTAAKNKPQASGSTAIDLEGFEDEDYELQAALQASLVGVSSENIVDPPVVAPPLVSARPPFPLSDSGPSSGQGSGVHTPTQQPYPGGIPPYSTDSADIDPVAASMERNRFVLQRMREQQEYARRELWADGARPGGFRAGRQQGGRGDAEEEEMLRRAIAESEALVREGGSGQDIAGDDKDEDEDEDEDEDAEGDIDMELDEPQTLSSSQNAYPARAVHADGDRVYDDDDAELQAALKESLEHAPEGWVPPVPQSSHNPLSLPSHLTTEYASVPGSSQEKNRDDVESVSSEETGTTEMPSSDAVESTADSFSVDELRRRRLARFET